MFPFAGGLVGGQSTELLVPGQDSPAFIFENNGGFGPGTSDAGLNFTSVGTLQTRRNGVLDVTSPVTTEMWIASDSQAVGVGAAYEARFTSVIGDVGFIAGGPIDTWLALSSNRLWYVFASGTEFEIDTKTVQGLFQVREIANPSNIVTGDVTLSATWEGNL